MCCEYTFSPYRDSLRSHFKLCYISHRIASMRGRIMLCYIRHTSAHGFVSMPLHYQPLSECQFPPDPEPVHHQVTPAPNSHHHYTTSVLEFASMPLRCQTPFLRQTHWCYGHIIRTVIQQHIASPQCLMKSLVR